MATVYKQFVVKNGFLSQSGNIEIENAGDLTIKDITNTQVFGIDGATGAVTIGSGGNAYQLPTSDGTADQFLKTDGNGNLVFAAVPSGSFTIRADNGTDDTFTTGEILTFSGNTGIQTTVTDNQIDIVLDLGVSDTTTTTQGDLNLDFTLTGGTLSATGDAYGLSATDTPTFSSLVLDSTGTITFGTNSSAYITGEDGGADTISFYADSNLQLLVDGNGILLSNAKKVTYQNAGGTFFTDLVATDPTANRTITLPDASGTVAVSVSDTTTSTQGDLNLDFTLSAAGDVSAVGDAHGLATSDSPTFAGMTISGDSVTIGDSSNTAATATIFGPGTITLDPYQTGANGTVIIAGDLQVNGTQTIINSTTLQVDDKLVELGAGATDKNASNGGGITLDLGSDGSATILYDAGTDAWVFNQKLSGDGSLLTDIAANTADQWTTGRTVTFAGGDVTGSFTIDGSADVSNVALTIGADSVALGTDTTGDYVGTITAGTGLSSTGATTGEGVSHTISLSHLGLESLTDPNADRILFWDDSAGATAWLEVSTGLDLTGTVLTNSDTGSSQNIFKTIETNDANTVVATSNSDTLKIKADGGLYFDRDNTDDHLLTVRPTNKIDFGSSDGQTAGAQNTSIGGYYAASVNASHNYTVITQSTNKIGNKLIIAAVDASDATSKHILEVLVTTDNTDTYVMGYGDVYTSSPLFSIAAGTNPGELAIVPESGVTMHLKIQDQSV